VKPGTSPECFEELRAQSQHCLILFLTLEIELGFTLVDLDHLEHSQRAREEARNAVASIRHFLNRISNPEIRDVIADRCAELDRAVADL
jgi:hypothetical protein